MDYREQEDHLGNLGTKNNIVVSSLGFPNMELKKPATQKYQWSQTKHTQTKASSPEPEDHKRSSLARQNGDSTPVKHPKENSDPTHIHIQQRLNEEPRLHLSAEGTPTPLWMWCQRRPSRQPGLLYLPDDKESSLPLHGVMESIWRA